jgi:hypothetical protein
MDQQSAQRLRMMRLGGWSASVSGTIAVIGLVLRFARFAFPGGLVGWFNDLLVVIQYALALPIAIALHAVFRRYNPGLSWLALIVGVAGILSVVILQALLLVRALSFEQLVVPVSIAILVLGAWLVITGYLGRSTGLLRGSVRMSLVAVPYFGYPIWAWWLARSLFSRASERQVVQRSRSVRDLARGGSRRTPWRSASVCCISLLTGAHKSWAARSGR